MKPVSLATPEFIPPLTYGGDVSVAGHGLTLWVEKGFSRREITERMRTAAPSLKLYGTPEQPLAEATSLPFPVVTEADPVAIINQQVEQFGIEAIWPQKLAKIDLSDVACEVHAAASPEVIALVDDKVQFSEWLSGDPHQAEVIEATGVEQIAQAYETLRSAGKEVAVKPVIGVNGQGYWHLNENPAASVLTHPDEREIHPEVYFKALSLEEAAYPPQRMMVMEWLPGEEVSLDLLCWRGEPLIHAARTMLPNSYQRIQSEHPVVEHARSIAARLAMHGIVSLQYKQDAGDQWKMLEINPRPAGGSIKSEDAGFGTITNWARLVAHDIESSDVIQHQDDVTIGFRKVVTPLL